MIDELLKTGISKVLSEDYPHLLQPAVMYARVTGAANGGSYNVYALKILDKNGNVDNGFAEIPNVRSAVSAKSGDTVAVALPYGELNPYIIGVKV